MKKVITYGTFDLLHQGHVNILKRAKEQGDYLIVGVTSENYDEQRGKLNVMQSLFERIENVKKTGLADQIVVEEYMGQKIQDIQKYGVDKFVIGSDWLGKFDYLNEYCEVIYLDRTVGISSTDLRNSKNNILRLGVVGNGRIAKRFVKEARFVSGLEIEYVFGRNENRLSEFCKDYSLVGYDTDYDVFLEKVDAVYIALPHTLHYVFAKEALLKGKHVLCEKPITLSLDEAKELYTIAKENNLIIQEAIKTVYAPCFARLLSMVKSGVIGKIKDVEATFTKLINDKTLREYDLLSGGGSLTELGSYPLCLITKVLGTSPKKVIYTDFKDKETGVDLMNKTTLIYSNAIATSTVGIGVKKEGNCIISGTEGYIYIPAPWWKTEYFEVRFENQSKNKKVYVEFTDDGLRYEIADFLKAVNTKKETYKLTFDESLFISSVIDAYKNNGEFSFEKEYICLE
ncbi:MAG: glycerol-3-phosphate cytidylyltransferase [Alphaproteobacteria bacterium]|nr:glycerol-3-phosphate cytidylyltransferase [Alphaproteobacteria bacterium]